MQNSKKLLCVFGLFLFSQNTWAGPDPSMWQHTFFQFGPFGKLDPELVLPAIGQAVQAIYEQDKTNNEKILTDYTQVAFLFKGRDGAKHKGRNLRFFFSFDSQKEGVDTEIRIVLEGPALTLDGEPADNLEEALEGVRAGDFKILEQEEVPAAQELNQLQLEVIESKSDSLILV